MTLDFGGFDHDRIAHCLDFFENLSKRKIIIKALSTYYFFSTANLFFEIESKEPSKSEKKIV